MRSLEDLASQTVSFEKAIICLQDFTGEHETRKMFVVPKDYNLLSDDERIKGNLLNQHGFRLQIALMHSDVWKKNLDSGILIEICYDYSSQKPVQVIGQTTTTATTVFVKFIFPKKLRSFNNQDIENLFQQHLAELFHPAIAVKKPQYSKKT